MVFDLFPHIDLMRLLKESGSIIDLEERIKKEDKSIKFKTPENYVTFLNDKWNAINYRLWEQKRNFKETNELPVIEINIEETSYNIYGIVHGHRGLLGPGWHLRKKLKKEIEDIFGKYHNPKEGEEYYYEERFRKVLSDLIPANELKDITEVRKDYKEQKTTAQLLKLPLKYFLNISLLPLTALLWGGLAMFFKHIDEPKDPSIRYTWLSQKALSSMQYQTKSTNFLINRLEMLQPFNLEKEYVEKRATAELQKISHLNKKRSLWTARKLLEIAEKNKLKKVHYLGGAKHLTEIAYFLKNPSYSFKKLDDYFLAKSSW